MRCSRLNHDKRLHARHSTPEGNPPTSRRDADVWETHPSHCSGPGLRGRQKVIKFGSELLLPLRNQLSAQSESTRRSLAKSRGARASLLVLARDTVSPDVAALLDAVNVLRKLNAAGRTSVPEQATTPVPKRVLFQLRLSEQPLGPRVLLPQFLELFGGIHVHAAVGCGASCTAWPPTPRARLRSPRWSCPTRLVRRRDAACAPRPQRNVSSGHVIIVPSGPHPGATGLQTRRTHSLEARHCDPRLTNNYDLGTIDKINVN